MLSCIHLSHWILIYSYRNQQIAQNFFSNLVKVALSVGIHINTPFFVMTEDENKFSFLKAIKNNINEKIQCIVCILPTSKKEIYNEIKKLCSIECSIPSQCIVAK